MEIRNLGSSGLRVSTIGMGCNNFGGRIDLDATRAVIHKAIDLGITLFDTSDTYGERGGAETAMGQVFGDRRKDIVLATKFGNPMDDIGVKQGGARRYIMTAVEDSLRRLRTDRIDLYQLHRHDAHTDLDETLGALSDLVHEGKVLAVGSSTFPAEWIVEAAWVAERRGRERLSTEQPPYSILARGIETAVLPTCERHGLGVLVWSPLNGGWLTGKYRRGAEAPPDSRASTNPDHFRFSGEVRERKLDAVESLLALAGDIGVPLTHLALAFTLAHPAVTSTIIGPRTPKQLRELIGASELDLDGGVLARIDEIVPPGVNLDPADAG